MNIREALWGKSIPQKRKEAARLRKLNALPTEKEIDRFGRKKGRVIDINGKWHKKGRKYRGPKNHE